jgi:hypothetical protein
MGQSRRSGGGAPLNATSRRTWLAATLVACVAAVGLGGCGSGDSGSAAEPAGVDVNASAPDDATYWEGFSKGADNGTTDGNDDGREQGSSDGQERGYDRGYDDGVYDAKRLNRYGKSQWAEGALRNLAPPYYCPSSPAGNARVPPGQDSAWEEGFRKGYMSSYEEMYGSGCDEGFVEGFTDAYDIGYDEGYAYGRRFN